MQQELLNIIISAVSIILTGLVTWGVKVLTSWLNSKIKNEELKKHSLAVTEIVADAIMAVNQTFTSTLKKEGKFDKKAQEEAKNQCLAIIKKQLTAELKTYIETNFGDLEEWLNSKIEALIYTTK